MQSDKTANNEKLKAILDSEYLTEPTRKVLLERFDKMGSNYFFDNHSFQLLSRVCDLLMDQDSEDRMVNVALFIDERLKTNDSDGWRYDAMPPDRTMYVEGLKSIDEISVQKFKQNFIGLEREQQLHILSAIQEGNVDSEIWQKLDPKLFFEELLAETAEIFYSNPTVQSSINYVGMADAKGWTKLKLNQSENLENRK